jgi:glycosyltransferase involved in cell wall biosynthesis
MKELISVIVCTYNQEGTIARTLDSILRQQCHVPVEIILGEDCSTDHTLDVCRQYAERYPNSIRLFANAHNKGIIDNYFDCLLAAQGQYIADCAGDDEWSDPEKLEKELRIMEAHPEVALVHTDFLNRDAAKGTIFSPHPHPFLHTPKGGTEIVAGQQMLVPILTQLRRPTIHLCTALYRAETIRQAYERHTAFFRNKTYGCEDVQVCFMLAMSGKVAYLNEPTLYYTVGGKTISNTQEETRQFYFVKNATQLVYDLAQAFDIHHPYIQKFFDYRLYALLMHAFRSHSNKLRTEALLCQKDWNARLNIPTRIIRFVTSTPCLWSCTLKLRRLLTTYKLTTLCPTNIRLSSASIPASPTECLNTPTISTSDSRVTTHE